MKAITWHGKHDVRYETVDDPEVLNPRDAIIRVTSTAICGSDLHLYDGYIPAMKPGDVLGHEFMGEVVEVGSGSTLKPGQRVVVPFTISCGRCYHCEKHQYSGCENGNPADKQDMGRELYGQPTAGLFGYSHLTGGYSGGQAEYVRVPFSDVGPLVIPDDSIEDDKVLFLTDILPTGWMGAENAEIEPGDTVAVWGCGPVGQFCIISAYLLGAEKVIAIDRVTDRLTLAKEHGGAEIINYEDEDVFEALREMTGGRGPDACIDAVGLEAHGFGIAGAYDKAKQAVRLQTDRPTVLRQAIQACGKGGVISLAGVYGGVLDKVPLGAAFNKSLTFKMGQTHVHRFLPDLLRRVQEGEIDPTFLITHRMPLDQGPDAYKQFKDKEDGCVKVVLKPGQA